MTASADPIVPPFDARPEHADTQRLLGMVFALSAEVFVLKAQMHKMEAALRAAGALDDVGLDAAGKSREVAQWLAAEGRAFSDAVLRPFAHPDVAVDASAFMQEA